MHLDKAGARMADKIHDGMGVVTQHVAITQEYELSLQTVDPSVTMPYWDYTIDSMQAKMRGKVDNSIFTDSKLFSADFFGTTHGTEHYIADGRFEKQQVATTNSSDQIQSPFGYLRAPWNLNPSPYVSRYHKMCGMSIEKIYDESLKGITDLHWPTCKAHYSLTFGEDTQTWYDWVWSSSYLPHGPVHAWIGGIYGEECGSKMQALKSFMGDKDVARTSLYLFTLLKNMWRDELIEFPNYCSLDSIEDCAVVCTREDPQFYLKFKHYFANNDVRIVGGMDKHELDAVSDLALCDNTYWPGDHLEAASPVDVSFWPIHPTLDRLLQFKQLTTPFTDTTWDFSEDDDDSKSYCTTHESNHCFGHHQYDLTFWKSAYYDDEVGGYKTEYLTNGEIFRIINPNTYSAPYIYDNFEWDHCAEAGVSFKHAGYHYEGRNNEGQPM